MVFPEVAEILAEIIETDPEDIQPETKFAIDDGIEMIHVAKLIIACEKKFNITIHDEDIHTFKCAGDLADYIDKILYDGRVDFSESSDETRESWFYK